MARAVVTLSNPGGELEDVLHLVHKEKPHPDQGQVLVRITVRPVNPVDIISFRAGYFVRDQNATIGSEGFGIVEEVGVGVTKFIPGQRVIPLIWLDYVSSGQGSWQDYIVMKEKHVIPVPDGVSDETAAQFLINPWTVYGLLDDLAIPKGEYIVQTAAASVLGRQLIQLAKHRGIKTINIIRRDKWTDELKAIGADEVISSTTEDIVARVKEITEGKLAYCAIDAVGGSLTKTVAASVRDGSKVFVYGLLSGWEISLNVLDMLRNVQVSWWMLSNYVKTDEKIHYVASEVMKLLELNIVTPLAGKKFKLEDFKAAIKEAETEGRSGKVLLLS
eukprot:c43587_g1_i1 orf=249-1244(+)